MSYVPPAGRPRPAEPPPPSGGALALAIAAIALVGYATAPRRRRVFVSYDHELDLRYRNLLLAWDANPRFPFRLALTSPTERIASDDDAVVKRALTAKLKAAEYLLVVIGPETWKSAFVRWEIERAMADDVALKLVGVKVKQSYRSPDVLLGVGAAWARTFSVDAVTRALESAG